MTFSFRVLLLLLCCACMISGFLFVVFAVQCSMGVNVRHLFSIEWISCNFSLILY